MKIRRILTVIFALVGFALTIKLCEIYYNANFAKYALPSFCTVNDVIDCDGVAKTSYSQFFGIPLCLWGMLLYLFTLLLLFADKLKNCKYLKFLEVFKNPECYIFILYSVAFAISMLLAGISVFRIEKICVLCVATYFIDLGIAILNKDYTKNLFYELKQSFEDFISAVKIKQYLIAFISVVTAGIVVLTYTSVSLILAPQLKTLKGISAFSREYKTNGNIIGNPNSKVTVHTYLDYNCPACFLVDLSLKRAITELKGLMIIHHNFPLDAECNEKITQGTHKGSCAMARYVLAAKKQNKYWELNDLFFEKTPATEKEIKKIVKQVNGLNYKQLIEDANSEDVKAELKQELENVVKNNFDGTPTIIINGKKHVGNIPYPQLKQKLIDAGAEEK